ncbi:MAG TPA: lysophospholipid acyltransferase family protein [Fimbriimonadaceae bacterium]|nr:lysophospholipid acyltransferase family protein [Fimbriimonadaceae bacterium]
MAELLPARPYPALSRYLLLPLGKLFCRILFLFLGPITARGAYRVPRKGPLLILSNHLADIDPIAVQVACPRPVHFMAKSELFDIRVLGKMIRWYQAFPVKRGEPDRASMRHAIELLKMGEVVVVFPEGQLSEEGKLQELKAGIALIIRQAGAPVICCGLRNTNKVMPYGRVLPRISWSRVWVNWGEVREFGKDASTDEILEWAAGQLRELTDVG